MCEYLPVDTKANTCSENVSEQVLALVSTGRYSHILAPATVYGKNILPRVAAKLDIGQISEITKVITPGIFERPIYAGNAIATVEALDSIKALTVRAVSFDAAGADGSAQVQNIAAAADSGLSVFLTRDLATSARPELTSAKVVVAGGK